MKYLDFLYGTLDIKENIMPLLQCKEVARLHDISLSAVPPIFLPCGNISSRFEHSLGVAHLAKILCKREGFGKFSAVLPLAALLHDAGHPPFSHISDVFLEEVTGKRHEQFAEDVLKHSEIREIAEGFGFSMGEITGVIKGKGTAGELINGSIDLDNIDNSLRYGMSGGIIGKMYLPKKILNAFIQRDGVLFLDKKYAGEIRKWESCRKLVYDFVYGDGNISPESMLFRAIALAFEDGEIQKDFFSKTDGEALRYLENECNPAAGSLIKDLKSWRFYRKAFELKVRNPADSFKKEYTGLKGRKAISEFIGSILNIEERKICVTSARLTGTKNIHMPFLDGNSVLENRKTKPEEYVVKIFVDPSAKINNDKLEREMKKLLHA